MKKLLLFILLLLISACSSSKPEDLLKKAYENQSKLKNYTYDCSMKISVSDETGYDLSMPMDFTTIVDTKGTEDKSDDESYTFLTVSILGYDSKVETWMKDDIIYTDDGESKKYTHTKDTSEDTFSDFEQFVSLIIENAENISVEKSGSDNIVTLKLKDGGVENLLSYLGQGDISDLDDSANIVYDDIILTIDSKKLIRKLSLSGSSTETKGNTSVELTMTLKDENNSSIPFYNPNEFVEDYYSDGSFETVVFDDGLEITISMNNPKYMCYFDDEEQFLSIHNGEKILADGLFLSSSVIKSIYDSIEEEGTYLLRYTSEPESYGAVCRMKVCYSPETTDIFNPETPFAVIVFEDIDVGLMLIGFGSEEEFKDVMDQTSYYIYQE